MSIIKKIIITGDFLRVNNTGHSSQNINIRWLYFLLQPSLQLITSLPVEPLYFDGEKRGISLQFYAHNNYIPSIAEWAKLFAREPYEREQALLFDKFSDALVVSFELPEIIKKGFIALDIPYIDFTINPIRFLDDLLFGVRSNIEGLDNAFEEWKISQQEIIIGAGLAKATLSRLPRLPFCMDAKDIALFAGQTSDDKVLIKKGHFISVNDLLDSLSDIAVKHEKILVKPHPYAKENKIIFALTRLFPNVELVDNNFYYLLSHDAINTVYSVTSSTSIEASYWDKKGVHLASYPYIFSEKFISENVYLTIKPDIFQPELWKKILRHVHVQTISETFLRIKPERNWARRSLRNYWGADIFL